ncbi:MAG: lysophospholipid acyltransferase family protein [Gemmatimonadaceae bacterium]
MIARAKFWLRASAGGLGFGLAVAWYVVLRWLTPASRAYCRESFARTMARLCCGPCGVRVTIVHGERAGQVHPCVYACNHQSQIDYPIVGNMYPGNTLVMASQIGDWPVMGFLFRSSGCIALDRDVPVRAAGALDEAKTAITRDGLSVWMFAEGTRGKVRGQLGKFKRGAFRLAAETGVPIVPVVISPLLPETDLRGRKLEPHEVVLTVLEPVYGTNEDELRDSVRALMQAHLNEYSPGI